MADATGLNTNPDLPRRGRRKFPLHYVQAARLAYLNRTIGCHRQLLRHENALLPSVRSRHTQI